MNEPAVKRRPWGCLLIGVMVLVVVPVLALWIFQAYSASRVRRMLADLRAAGLPTNAVELEAYYALPPEATNTAPLWMEAVAELSQEDYQTVAGELLIVGTGEGEVPPPGEPWPEEAAAEAHLERYAPSLEQLLQAAQAGDHARYPTDFSQGMNMSLDHLEALRAGTRLLSLHARCRARRGDASSAARSILAIIAMSESLRREPSQFSQLVRMAMTSHAAESLEYALTAVDFSDDDLALLQTRFEAIDLIPGLELLVIGERVLGVTMFQNPQLMSDDFDAAAARKIALTRQDDLAFYLETMARFQTAMKTPWPETRRAAAVASDEVSEQIGSPLGYVRYTMTNALTPSISAIAEAAARTQAYNQGAVAGLAAERYRRRHEKFPEKLEQLTPELLKVVPVDPFDAQPMRWQVQDEGATVYSVGRDGNDNHGFESDNYLEEQDIAFTVKP